MAPGSKFTRHSVACFGYDIPYAEAGSGDVIVSLPGSAGLEMSTAKDILAESYRVIELDPPGWGDTPALAAEMKQRHLAIVLAEVIADLGIARYHLIGTSMGGANAYWLAAQFPERVKSLTLEAPMVFHRQEDLHNPDEGFIQALRAGAPAPDVSGYPAPPPHPRKPWADANFFRDQMRKRFKMMAKTDYPGDNSALEEFAHRGKVPTTLLIGSEDEILKQSFADQFQVTVPHAHVVRIEGATHDIQNTAPEAFVAAMQAQVCG
ncbi:alpha/beta fold hydrolase [Altererythrobacter salegens]|uniref:Alpha/beta fold hydrolase n=1 Tax=Croceibacterium salegens TaxID=1737568 RepID=A0A6I4SXA8_9SPHN|nr:alpha/beta hydrolase [Croceibacterium salegens]MXO60665.1 alpha/beta fold hydrolase [Croceibacterium salegens]